MASVSQEFQFQRVGKKGAEIGEEMSSSSLSSSPARSSISTTALVGTNATATTLSLGVDDYHLTADLISVQERKDEAIAVIKSEVMAALNKEVKSLDEDSWMFEGPRSHIHLISRPGGLLNQRLETLKHRNLSVKR